MRPSVRIPAAGQASDLRLSAEEIRGIALLVLLFAAAAGLTVSVALLGRRLAGGPADWLPTGGLLLVGLLVGSIHVGLRLAWFWLAKAARQVDASIQMMIYPSASALALGCAIAMPGPGAAALGFWLPVVGAEIWAWVTYLRQKRDRDGAESEWEDPPGELSVFRPDREAESPQVVQQWTRSQSETGETIIGKLRATALGGERSLSLHIAFCPPLAARPEIAAELVSDAPGTVTVGQAEVFGARFDVRFLQPCEAGAAVEVEFAGGVEAR